MFHERSFGIPEIPKSRYKKGKLRNQNIHFYKHKQIQPLLIPSLTWGQSVRRCHPILYLRNGMIVDQTLL